ncbi:protein STICHEL-like 2 isoform X4 [Iris pallida]|uniref:DNA-directed DNA polymerase n=1 Tax=Iris pallida TaxID=29817 RepID=A0AAX6E8C6_IRIPA|nr:protein STICHEL-like 2 isoform X4 [Iris pallida]
MAEGRRNSVDVPLSKTLVALKRVRSLRDPDTNSMSKFAMAINSMNLDDVGLKELHGFGNESESDHNSLKKSSMVRIRGTDSRKAYMVRKPCRQRMKKSKEPKLVTRSMKYLEEEVNSCSESRVDRKVVRKKSGYHSWRKPVAALEDAIMSRVGTPCMSMSESRTNCSSWTTIGFPTDEVDVRDSNFNGCGISYCWSRTPRYRDPNLSPDVREEHPLLSSEGREPASREIVPYPETPRSLSQKFRPRSFSDLVGLMVVSNSLLYALSKGKIAPVYLFHGPRGTGKTSTARIFAAALNCLSLEEHRPCGFCRECVFLFSGRSRDVKELDAAKLNHKDRVKALIKSASLSPFSSHFKVFIIDECQFLRGETWAAIFNSVENLSQHSVFIMITTDPAKLPSSYVSQTQRYHFPKIKDVDISFRLQKICIEEGLEFDKDAVDFIAAKSNGSLRDAETILDQLGLLGKRITLSLAYELVGVVSDKELLNLLDLALSADTTNTVIRARDLMSSRIDPMQLISQLANLIMDILSGRCQPGFCNVGRNLFDTHDLTDIGMQKLRHALKILSETEKQLRTSKNQATWLTVALLQFGTGDDENFCSSSPRNSLKNSDCDEHNRTICPENHCDRTKLETIWRRTSRKCQSSSFKIFLQKEGNLSSISFNDGLAIAEIEFFHPDHLSKAEKSWKLIAHSLEDVLGCNVQIRLKLVPACIKKSTSVKKPSFSLLGCSGRNCQMSESTMTDENESDTSARRKACFQVYPSQPGKNLSSLLSSWMLTWSRLAASMIKKQS